MSRRNNYSYDDDNDQGNYGPYSTGKARSGQGDRRLDGGYDGRKKPGGNNPQGYNGSGKSGSGRNQQRYNNNNNYNNDDYSDDYSDDDNNNYNYGNNKQGGYGPYSTGKARSGQGDRRLDGGHDGRKKSGGNNPEGINGYTKNGGNNRNYNRSNNYNDDDNSDDYSDDDNNNYNYRNNNQGGYGPYSTGKARSGQGDRRLDGGHDGRKKSGGNNPQGINGYTKNSNSNNRNYNRSNNYNNDDYSDDYSDDDNNNYNYGNNNQGGYGPYSSGKARSGQGDKRLDGGHDGRKRPGGNNPQGINGYTKGSNQSRNYNRNNQNDNDDEYDSEDYGQNTRKQRNYSYNTTGRQNRSGPGDKKLDGGKDLRKKPNRSENYNENY